MLFFAEHGKKDLEGIRPFGRKIVILLPYCIRDAAVAVHVADSLDKTRKVVSLLDTSLDCIATRFGKMHA